MSKTAVNADRSKRASEGAKRRWGNAPPGAGRANLQAAITVGSAKRRVAHEVLSTFESAIVAAGGEVRWPLADDQDETP